MDDLRAAEHSVQAHLPIDAHATVVTLITQQAAGGRWTRTTTFALVWRSVPAAASSELVNTMPGMVAHYALASATRRTALAANGSSLPASSPRVHSRGP